MTTAADITALLAMLRQIQCEPASFDTYSMASAAERAADAIERLSLSATASDKDAARLRAALERHGTFHADAVRLVQGLFAAFDRPEVHAVAKAEATEWLERVTSRPVLSRAAMEKVNG